jgi:hypothetical protein
MEGRMISDARDAARGMVDLRPGVASRWSCSTRAPEVLFLPPCRDDESIAPHASASATSKHAARPICRRLQAGLEQVMGNMQQDGILPGFCSATASPTIRLDPPARAGCR